MQALLEALEGSAPMEALRASFVAYPLVNAFHILAVGMLVTGVLLLDLRTLGLLRTQPFAPFSALMRRLALAGFAGAALSGLALFGVQATSYVENSAFLVKMGLIGLAGLNFLVLAGAGRREGHGARLRVAALLSLAFWPAVLVAGRFIGFL